MELLVLSLLLLLSFSSAQQEGDVKLVGPTEYQGTVAVYHSGTWGTICDDRWNYRDADVVCKQLGFERAFRIYYRAYYGQGPGTVNEIWIDEMKCPQNVDHILDCQPPPSQWGIHDCKKNEDAGVDCLRKFPRKPAEMPIRLSCPECVQSGSCKACSDKQHPSPTDCSPQVAVEGVVFAYYENAWRPVSGEGWDERDAEVVCGELGYPVAFQPPTLQELWTNWDGSYLSENGDHDTLLMPDDHSKCLVESDGSGYLAIDEEKNQNDDFRSELQNTLLKKVQCEGKESRMLDCYFSEFGPHPNPSLNVATVRCGFKPHASCSQNSNTEVYRTRGSAVPWQGRVEVRLDGAWGTVCDQDWDMNEANVVCRAMGFGTAKRAHHRASYGRGVDPIHYSRLRCTGYELSLEECMKSTGPVAQECGHSRDAGVECNVPTTCPNPEAKKSHLIDTPQSLYPQYNDSYVEVNGPQGWGLLCRNSLTLQPAGVVCRSERGLFAVQVRSGHLEGYDGHRYVGTLTCTGEEASLDDCSDISLTTVTSCPKGDAIVDCTPGLPDLVPDLETLIRSLTYYPYIDRLPLYYLQCAQEEHCLSSSAEGKGPNNIRNLLRFDSLTMNWGRTDFLPSQNQDEWEFHSCHNHYHSFEAFIHFDLLNSTTGEKMAEGHKASFCLADSLCFGPRRRYSCASSGHQGISVNCGDLYGRYLDCQWIDITDVEPGSYVLRLIVNPDYLVTESDHKNNEAYCGIKINASYFVDYLWCRLSDH